MTQGNCCRMAVRTRSDSAAPGLPPPPAPPPASSPALPAPAPPAFLRSPHFLSVRPFEEAQRPLHPGTARCEAGGAGAPEERRGAWASALPTPGCPPILPPACAGSFVPLLPTTCLSRGPEGTPSQDPPAPPERLPPSTRALIWGPEGEQRPVARPLASLPSHFSLPFCRLYSRTRRSLDCPPHPRPPSPGWDLPVGTHSEHSKLSPSELGRPSGAARAGCAHAARDCGRGCLRSPALPRTPLGISAGHRQLGAQRRFQSVSGLTLCPPLVLLPGATSSKQERKENRFSRSWGRGAVGVEGLGWRVSKVPL